MDKKTEGWKQELLGRGLQEIRSRGLRPNPDLTNWDEKSALDSNGQEVLLGYAERTAMVRMIREGHWGGSKEYQTKAESRLVTCLQFLALDHDVKIASLSPVPTGKELEIFETSIRTDNPLFCIGYQCFDCIEQERGTGDDFDILREIECLLDVMISAELSSAETEMIWETGELGMSRRGLWNILARLSREVLRLRGYRQERPSIVFETFITVGKWVEKTSKPK